MTDNVRKKKERNSIQMLCWRFGRFVGTEININKFQDLCFYAMKRKDI